MDLWLLITLISITALIFFRHKIIQEWKSFRSDRNAWLKRMWKEWGEPFLVAALIAIVIRTFFLGPYKIPTGSMRPTLLEGDRIFVDKITYRFRLPKRGEIVVFKYPEEPKKDYVKRLVAFGGEEVEIRDGAIYINGTRLDDVAGIAGHYYYNRNDWPYAKEGQTIQVPEGFYFVLGDNSAQSSDSRKWGFVPKSNMIGRAFLIWWPVFRIGFTP
jgi:signal peptidase I